MDFPKGIYIRGCPNCEGPITDLRLYNGLVCENCFPYNDVVEEPKALLQKMKDIGTLKELEKYYEVNKELEEFEHLFYSIIKSKPWSAQKTWAKRVFLRKNFSIIAPTGVGKTVFGIIMAIYLAKKGHKSCIVLPTRALANQVCDKIASYANEAGLNLNIICTVKEKNKEEMTSRIQGNDFDILVTTSKFIIVKNELLYNKGFSFVFVDDVDSVLKSGRSIDAVLNILGFTESIRKDAQELIKLKMKLRSHTLTKESYQKLYSQIEEISERINRVKENSKSVLVVSSATGRQRGAKIALFKELLGFLAGSKTEQLRNVVDAYEYVKSAHIKEKLLQKVKNFGKGGLIFVPIDLGTSFAEEIANYLQNKGIKAEAVSSKNVSAIERFISGDVDILVGTAAYYGILVRGLDIPWRVRYAIFTHVPRFKFSLNLEGIHPLNIVRLLSIISSLQMEPYSNAARRYLIETRKILNKLSPSALSLLANKLREGVVETKSEEIFKQALDFLRESLSQKNILEKLQEANEIVLRKENEEYYIYIPDIKTYVQASGRTSRLYAGGLTKGLSLVFVNENEQNLFKIFLNLAKFYTEGVVFQDIKDINVKKILEEVDEDRKRVLKVIKGEFESYELKDFVKSALMIVESPNKAKTISNFFGKPSLRILEGDLRAYEVSIGNLVLIITASGGHIVDLIPSANNNELKKYSKMKNELYGILFDESGSIFLPVYSTIKKCLVCGHQFTEDTTKCPRCGSSLIQDKIKNVKVLRELASEVDEVLIATDPDTEGEKIGWDISVLLRPFTKNIRRITFHEITKRAILDALKEKRLLDERLVESQIVRRIEDRWIGFSLSQKLQTDFWKEYCSKYMKNSEKCAENRNLSAGRVQTPVLGWINKRYEDHLKSKKEVINIVAKKGINEVHLSIVEDELPIKPEELHEGKKINVEATEGITEMNPSPPFTTDSMLSEANRRYYFSADKTMGLAQDLFEAGLITYHRTDSTRVSPVGIEIAKTYLSRKFGDSIDRIFVPRQWGEGGAHEAIRPTKPIDVNELIRLIDEGELILAKQLTKQHYELYDLIFRRFIASQMSKAKVTIQHVKYYYDNILLREEERLTSETIETGFMSMYNVLELKPKLVPGSYTITEVRMLQRKMIPLYTQADVVSLMKEKKLGRPSTYATIISKLLTRRYVIASGRFKKLVPTKLGKEVYYYLTRNFYSLVNEERTRTLEEKMDFVSEGKEDYLKLIRELLEEIKSIQ